MFDLIENNQIVIRPFLRWAGGKFWLRKTIQKLLPNKINGYHEPFLGGGAAYFCVTNYQKAYLSDINKDLISTYVTIKNDYTRLEKELKGYRNSKSEYYKIRDQQFKSAIKKSAQFLYLNRTSFNGIYRVNLKGEYNVPYGHRQYKTLFDFKNLQLVSSKLNGNTELCTQNFISSFENIKKGDLVFLDPPYTAFHENNGFLKYNEKIFTWDDQLSLREYVRGIIQKKAFFILTNAAHKEIKNLYKPIAEPIIVKRTSTVGSNKESRKEIHEFLFTNCL